MTIKIENLTFNTIIGILPKERITPQKVVLHVELDYEYKNGSFIDYAAVTKTIQNNMVSNKYNLIEDALLALHVELKEKFNQISSLNLKISKPTILDNCDVSVSLIRKY